MRYKSGVKKLRELVINYSYFYIIFKGNLKNDLLQVKVVMRFVHL